MDMKTAINAFEALAHETRLGVFRVLVQAGPAGMPAGEIARSLGVIQNTMSSHLQKLQRAGIVTDERVGRQVIYRANFSVVSALILFLMEDCCAGSVELCEPIAASMAC